MNLFKNVTCVWYSIIAHSTVSPSGPNCRRTAEYRIAIVSSNLRFMAPIPVIPARPIDKRPILAPNRLEESCKQALDNFFLYIERIDKFHFHLKLLLSTTCQKNFEWGELVTNKYGEKRITKRNDENKVLLNDGGNRTRKIGHQLINRELLGITTYLGRD